MPLFHSPHGSDTKTEAEMKTETVLYLLTSRPGNLAYLLALGLPGPTELTVSSCLHSRGERQATILKKNK